MSYKITTKMSWSQTMNDLAYVFDRWKITDWEVNYPRGAHLTGWSQSEQDRTVTLRYKKDGKEVALSYGQQERAVDNFRALYLTIDDMFMAEHRGLSSLIASAYKQLGSGMSSSDVDPYQELGILRGYGLSVYEATFRDLAKKYHPDSKPDGSADKMEHLNQAIKLIRTELE